MHLGIITCEILRKEIKDVVKEIGADKIFLVLPETHNLAVNLSDKLINDRFLSEWGDLKGKIRETSLEKIEKEFHENNLKKSVIIKVKELRLHDKPDKLWDEIEEEIEKMSPLVDFILLGYGLCGNNFKRVDEILSKARVPVILPRDKKGEVLNNCIEIALGREKVQSLLQEESGTFFMTPTGASIVKEPHTIMENDRSFARNNTIGTEEIIKILNHYKRVIKVYYSAEDKNGREFSRIVENFANKFNLKIESEKGSSKVIFDALLHYISKGGR